MASHKEVHGYGSIQNRPEGRDDQNPQEVGAIGTALVAAAGIKGVDVLELSSQLVKVTHTYIPDPEKRDVYERSYKVFKKLYKSNAANFKELNS